MAFINSDIVLALLFVLIGTIVCSAKECTKETLDECTYMRRSKYADCPPYTEQVKCFIEIEPQCTDSELIRRLTNDKEWSLSRSERCPGLAQGVCYWNAVDVCTEYVPYVVAAGHDEDKLSACKEFESKSNDTKSCLEKIKSHCVSRFVHSEIDKKIKSIQNIDSICGF